MFEINKGCKKIWQQNSLFSPVRWCKEKTSLEKRPSVHQDLKEMDQGKRPKGVSGKNQIIFTNTHPIGHFALSIILSKLKMNTTSAPI